MIWLDITITATNRPEILFVTLHSFYYRMLKKIKGNLRPILNQKARKKILSALEPIDYIVTFKEKTPYRLLKALRPHCLIKGRDWGTQQIIGREFAKKVVRIGLDPRYSTSKIIQKIAKK